MQGETTSAFVQTETTPQTKVHPHYYTRILFRHQPHEYEPRNVNQLQAAEQAGRGFNTRLAVALTKYTGTMWTAYLFAGIGIGSLVGVITDNAFPS